MEMYTLLAEIGGMIGTPQIDIDTLKRQSPNKESYNLYKQGNEELQNIMATRKLGKMDEC